MVTPQTALIYTMVLVSASDHDMTDAELKMIGTIVSSLPVFAPFNIDLLPQTAAGCADLLQHDNGLDEVLDQVRTALPLHLRETAYALACDVAAADGTVELEEMRLLEMIRHRLEIDRLTSAALERGARARFNRE